MVLKLLAILEKPTLQMLSFSAELLNLLKSFLLHQVDSLMGRG
jgi:hypothetical protein